MELDQQSPINNQHPLNRGLVACWAGREFRNRLVNIRDDRLMDLALITYIKTTDEPICVNAKS